MAIPNGVSQPGSLAIREFPDACVSNTGSFTLEGEIAGPLWNDGMFDPEGTPYVGGFVRQSSLGTTLIDIASPSRHDTVVVDGDAELAGTIRFSFLFTPATGDSFQFLADAYSITDNGVTIEVNGFDPTRLVTDLANGTITIVDPPLVGAAAATP